MTKNTEKFLETYKKLETTLRKAEQFNSVFEYENSLTDPEIVEKLKLCRLTRNYIVHNENSVDFVAPTSEMISFLAKQCEWAQKRVKTLEDACTIVNTIKASKPITIRMVLKNLNDNDFTFWPVSDEEAKKIIGIVDLKTIASALKHANYKMTANFFENVSLNQLKNNFKNDYVVLKKDEEYSKYADVKKPIIVDFGHGKYVGVIVKE